MARVQRIGIWFGGVLAPTLSQAALAAFKDQEQPRPGGLTREPLEYPQEARLRLLALEKKLALGQLDPASFCRAAIRLAGAAVSSLELSAGIREQISPRQTHPALLSLIGELVSRYPLDLICDYPQEWVLTDSPGAIATDVGWQALFSPESVFFTANYHPARSYQDLLQKMYAEGPLWRGKTLLVDADPARNRLAIRMGLDVAVFVDARRLRRDLALWGLVG